VWGLAGGLPEMKLHALDGRGNAVWLVTAFVEFPWPSSSLVPLLGEAYAAAGLGYKGW